MGLLRVPPALQWLLTSIWSNFENLALGPELPVPVKDWKRYVDDVIQHHSQRKQEPNAPILKLH